LYAVGQNAIVVLIGSVPVQYNVLHLWFSWSG